MSDPQDYSRVRWPRVCATCTNYDSFRQGCTKYPISNKGTKLEKIKPVKPNDACVTNRILTDGFGEQNAWEFYLPLIGVTKRDNDEGYARYLKRGGIDFRNPQKGGNPNMT